MDQLPQGRSQRGPLPCPHILSPLKCSTAERDPARLLWHRPGRLGPVLFRRDDDGLRHRNPSRLPPDLACRARHAQKAHRGRHRVRARRRRQQRRDGPGRLGLRRARQVAPHVRLRDAPSPGPADRVVRSEFTPTLSATPIPIPPTDPPTSFVIAHTLVTADKHVTAKIHYNLRVVECRVGARLLALHLSLPSARSTAWDFGKVLDAWTDQRGQASGKSPEEQAARLLEMAKIAEEALGSEDGMTWAEVLDKLQMDQATFDREVKGGFEVEAPDGKLKVLRRARHVVGPVALRRSPDADEQAAQFSEARRVYLFRQLLESSGGTDLPKQMGGLMNESQASCAGDFDCSCPEINEIVDIARRSGSYGSRLTGPSPPLPYARSTDGRILRGGMGRFDRSPGPRSERGRLHRLSPRALLRRQVPRPLGTRARSGLLRDQAGAGRVHRRVRIAGCKSVEMHTVHIRSSSLSRVVGTPNEARMTSRSAVIFLSVRTRWSSPACCCDRTCRERQPASRRG